MSYFLYNKEDVSDNHYIVFFKLIFVKGKLIDISLLNTKTIDKKQYTNDLNKVSIKVNKKLKKINSNWYKYLYRPYYALMIILFGTPIFVLQILRIVLIKIFEFITPL